MSRYIGLFCGNIGHFCGYVGLSSWQHFTGPVRGVIVVSIVSGGGEVCIAYTSVLVNLWDPKHVLGYFVRVLLGWLRNRSLCQIFSVNPSLLYEAVGTQANVAKISFKLKSQIEMIFRRLLASPRLGTKGAGLLKTSGTSFGCLVNRAKLVQIS